MSDFVSHEAPAREVAALPVLLTGKPVGRDTYLARVYAQLKVNQPVQLTGAAGSGKTQIAAALAGAYTQQPGGVLWLTVNRAPLEELLVRIGRAYNLRDVTSSENPLALVGSVASALMQHKPLLVLDGALDDTVAAEFISKCAQGLPLILIADTHIATVQPVIEVLPLDPQPAAVLYKQISGESDDAAIAEVVQALAYHPFAITLLAAAARSSKQPTSLYAKALAQLPAGSAVNNALTIAFKSLSNALQGLLLMMSATYGGAASAEMLSMLSNAPLETAQQAGNILAAQFLLERSQRYGSPYYRLHPLTRAFAQNILRNSNRLEALQAKVRDTVLAYAQKYSSADPTAHNRLAAEMEAFLALAKTQADEGERGPANQLVLALMQAGDFVKVRGYVYELLRLRYFASGMTTAFPAYAAPTPVRPIVEDAEEDEAVEEESDEVFAVSAVLDEALMDAAGEEDEIDEELIEDTGAQEAVAESEIELNTDNLPMLRAALTQARQRGDKDRQIAVLNAIGKAQVDQQMENEAIATYSEVLNLYESKDDDSGVLETLDTLSVLMTKTDNSQAAVLHATRGIKLAEQLDDADTRMHMLMTLGDARQQLGESGEAIRAYSQALEIARKRDDKQNEALSLFKLGYAQLDNGEPETAIATWEQALTMFREQRRREYEGRVLGGLGTANAELERWSEAINYHSSALHIAREVDDKEEEALQLNNLGHASVEAGQLGQAVLRYRQALHLAYLSGDRENIVTTIVDLARLLSRSARHLTVAELLIDDALRLEPTARDVRALKDRISAQIGGVDQETLIPVTGTAQDYAANAYKLLEG
ncbi:MAG: tetratricopeptide repeat protein [Chloroflexi bacterium]|nr:tetratricopeptide repeat protein [Chloroflexota bacterium]